MSPEVKAEPEETPQEEKKKEPVIVTELAQIGEAIKAKQEESKPREDTVLINGTFVPRKVTPPFYRIFVYGTMKAGHPNHHYVSKGKLLSVNAELDDYCLSMDGDLPVVFKHKKHHVWGTLYEINHAMLEEIDHLEGIRHQFYEREEVEVWAGSSTRKIPCLVYVRRPPITPTYRHIVSGTYHGSESLTSIQPTPDVWGNPRNNAATANHLTELDKQFPIGANDSGYKGAAGHLPTCNCPLCWNIRQSKIKIKSRPPLLDPGVFLWGTPYLDDGNHVTFK